MEIQATSCLSSSSPPETAMRGWPMRSRAGAIWARWNQLPLAAITFGACRRDCKGRWYSGEGSRLERLGAPARAGTSVSGASACALHPIAAPETPAAGVHARGAKASGEQEGRPYQSLLKVYPAQRICEEIAGAAK